MRAPSGFDRPSLQWTFVALAVVLMAAVVALSAAVWRSQRTVRELHDSREQLAARLAREQATREALSLEIARLRGAGAPTAKPVVPTLTLEPLRARAATPPAATMSAPAAAQAIELRLVLPRAADTKHAPYEITVRDWVTGQVRLTRGGLKAARIGDAQAVATLVTGDVFAPGSHEVLLKGSQSDVASYEITIK